MPRSHYWTLDPLESVLRDVVDTHSPRRAPSHLPGPRRISPSSSSTTPGGPVVCWAIIGTTTCFSRSVQLWVTSNILVGRNSRGEGRLGPRRWDWGEVGRKCVLPAGFLYFITTWLLLLKGELLGIS